MKNPTFLLMFAAIPLLSASILSQGNVADNAVAAANSGRTNYMSNNQFMPGRWISGTSYEPETVYSSSGDQRTGVPTRMLKPPSVNRAYAAPAVGVAHSQLVASLKASNWATKFADKFTFVFSAKNIAAQSNPTGVRPVKFNTVDRAAVYTQIADQKLMQCVQAKLSERAHNSAKKSASVMTMQATVAAGAHTPARPTRFHQRTGTPIPARPAREEDAKVAQQAVQFAQVWIAATISAVDSDRKTSQPRDVFEPNFLETVKGSQDVVAATKEMTFKVKNAGVLK